MKVQNKIAEIYTNILSSDKMLTDLVETDNNLRNIDSTRKMMKDKLSSLLNTDEGKEILSNLEKLEKEQKENRYEYSTENHEELVKTAVEEYSEFVSGMSMEEDFFDFGLELFITYDSAYDKVKEAVKEMKKENLPVEMVLDEKIGNNENDRYGSSGKIILLTRSSHLEEVKNRVQSEYDQQAMYKSDKSVDVIGHFITPLVRDVHKEGKTTVEHFKAIREHLKSKDYTHLDRLSLSSIGYMAKEMNHLRPRDLEKALFDSFKTLNRFKAGTFSTYESEFAGNVFFTPREDIKKVDPDREDKNVRINVEYDLQLRKLEKPEQKRRTRLKR